ncbi:transcriptional regulator domain-containing protein [Pigmentiphaga kullae]|uniref:Transcriptional regulator-like domain-containing protein n=1 Tax=Pigmentiphaga kullae TaxID=151784 RepID=A0A4Q7NN46_9BURK|nr:DUF6499 domain-containing protein [Pigmentiphaga kullae]RZS86563.1 hypothetical protein EV675_2610 [Pigmentiphaga kullae]
MGRKRKAIDPKEVFSDGLDDAAYAGFESWSNSHWAWEFLRRNPAFQDACNRVRSASRRDRNVLRAEVARQFFIRRYMHFRHDYVNHDPRSPMFVRVRGYSSKMLTKPTKISVTLQPDQFLVLFDIRQMRYSVRALNAQLAEAKRQMSVLISHHVSEGSAPAMRDEPAGVVQSRGRGEAKTWLGWLRMLDAKSHGVKNDRAYRSIFPGKCLGKDTMKIQQAYSDEWKSASSYASERYLQIGMRDKVDLKLGLPKVVESLDQAFTRMSHGKPPENFTPF